jgi:hypothetical protein
VNNHQMGVRRDRLVLDALAEWGTMDTEQIRLKFFPSDRVARRRLQIMTQKGKVRRIREAIETPYSYYLKRYEPERITLNWLRLWLLKRLKSWEVMEAFDYSTNTCLIRNTAMNTVKTYNVFYNVTRKLWIDGEAIIVFDHEEQRREAVKRIKATLLTVEEIREGLKC